jgi:ribosomal protein S1
MVVMMTGCNKQLFDVTYKFDKAIIQLPNGEIVEGAVDSWKDFEGDQIQVVIDGVTYLVHSEDVVLIND